MQQVELAQQSLTDQTRKWNLISEVELIRPGLHGRCAGQDPPGAGVKVDEFIAFWSPDGHSACKFTVEMQVGRLGAPVGGPKPF